MTLMLGKLDPVFPLGLRDLSVYAPALPAPPAATSFGALVHHPWPMLGNDQYGDCTLAAAGHLIRFWNDQTSETLPVPTANQVVSEYLSLTGGSDSGLVESDVLKHWQSVGLWTEKLIGFAPISTETELKQSIAFFGGAYIGFRVPANAIAQFDAGQPWTLVSGWRHQQIIGGHAVCVLGYDSHYLYVVTWNGVQPMAWSWWFAYGDEAWALLSEQYALAPVLHTAVNYAELHADLSTV